MKIYNKELCEVSNEEKSEFLGSIIERQIEFLRQTYDIGDEDIQERANKLVAVERDPKDATYFVEYKGEKTQLKNDDWVAAFLTKKKIEFDGENFHFENGIYISDNNSEHNISHELFHGLSEPLELKFEENGIGYLKSGVNIVGMDKNENDVDKSLHAKGLNEGITELLATQLDQGRGPNAYDYQVYLASILINGQHSSLLKAYFSEDRGKFVDSLKEFDSRQTIVSSKELINLPQDGFIEAEPSLLKGCLEYTLSFCNSMEELKAETKRILPILHSMSNNINIEFTDEQFNAGEWLYSSVSDKVGKMENKDIIRRDRGNVER